MTLLNDALETGKEIQELITYVKKCTSPYHTVKTSIDMLKKAGFVELSMGEEWNLQEGSYFVNVYGTTLAAFTIGKEARSTLRIASAHTDFPCFRIKPNPVIKEKAYGKLNVEAYGGLILQTWLDRPLSIAGTVVVRGESPFEVTSYLVDAKRPLVTIPSLAIHMNRNVNDGVALNKQKEMLPLFALFTDTFESDSNSNCIENSTRNSINKGTPDSIWKALLSQLIKDEEGIDINPEHILSYELSVYNQEEPSILGFSGEFVSSPRIDNLTSCLGCLKGIIESSAQNTLGIRMSILFDHEEVGSRSKQGGASTLLPNLVHRIYRALGLSEEACDADIAKGFMVSADVAHGYHPNYGEKNDVTNVPQLNHGMALKIASSQNYAGDAVAVGIISQLCNDNHIPYQLYVNRSDIAGGSTVGSISSAQLLMRTMDIGIPILAMHSARELMGVDDQIHLNQFMKVFLGT